MMMMMIRAATILSRLFSRLIVINCVWMCVLQYSLIVVLVMASELAVGILLVLFKDDVSVTYLLLTSQIASSI